MKYLNKVRQMEFVKTSWVFKFLFFIDDVSLCVTIFKTTHCRPCKIKFKKKNKTSNGFSRILSYIFFPVFATGVLSRCSNIVCVLLLFIDKIYVPLTSQNVIEH